MYEGMEADIAALLASGEFDENWYVETYPDVKILGMRPVEHYLWIGKRLGRSGGGDGLRAGQFDARYASDLKPPIPDVHLSEELRAQIEKSGFFDPAYYRSSFTGPAFYPHDLLMDYLGAFAIAPERDPGPLFSTSHYLKVNPDVRDMHPLVHFIQYGISEGRPGLAPEKVNAFLADAGNVSLPSITGLIPRDRPITVLHWEKGNFFFTDIARYLTQLLRLKGYDATLSTDVRLPASSRQLNVVVAPHEFCALGPGSTWNSEQYANACYVNTEQWQTSWFSLSLKYMRHSRIGTLDINPNSAGGLQKLGMRSAFLPLLPLKGSCFDIPVHEVSPQVTRLKHIERLTYPENFDDRPYDVAFVAVLNSRRAEALAQLAPVLADLKCFIHCPRSDRPLRPGDPDLLSGADFVQIARNTKVLLNIHQGDAHYLEWQRMFLMGMMEGCVVLSEPCSPNRLVRADEHYIEAAISKMAHALTSLLHSAEGRAKMSDIRAANACLRADMLQSERLLQL